MERVGEGVHYLLFTRAMGEIAGEGAGIRQAGDSEVQACWLGFLGFAKKGCVDSSWSIGSMWVYER